MPYRHIPFVVRSYMESKARTMYNLLIFQQQGNLLFYSLKIKILH